MTGMADLEDGPMHVVTAAAGGRLAGCLVGFAAQCSIEPERHMVWLSKANLTYRVASRAAYLGVHLLGPGQRPLAELFGGRTGDDTDKFAQARWSAGPEGVPLLAGVPAWYVGRIEGRTDGGDHVGHLLTPVASAVERGTRRGSVLTLADCLDITPGHPAG
ncbi:flavin reductase family protein [Streptomyces sp. 8L]|uniref:flavin reductase family protein n=1 Tax=Streptomyces sp. 8L TaxID=2877242 RepID=UPI001CD7595C|nr:flavin reductase family protein [Streptomyces sp. 8L]MCA1220896.1 flavin reductase family protein [Streptomyces sp. 8L]